MVPRMRCFPTKNALFLLHGFCKNHHQIDHQHKMHKFLPKCFFFQLCFAVHHILDNFVLNLGKM
jgi:hypothetical protein